MHQEKQPLREEMRARRSALPTHLRTRHDAAIRRNLFAFLSPGRPLLAFCPWNGEPDILPLLRLFVRSGCALAFPAIRDAGMVFHPVAGRELRFPERYRGIPQPDGASPPLADFHPETLCLVPGLAFTPEGLRLGYGGGFYDRHLEAFPGSSIGIAYSFQILNSLPAFDHDRPVDYICTETGVFPCRPDKGAHQP